MTDLQGGQTIGGTPPDPSQLDSLDGVASFTGSTTTVVDNGDGTTTTVTDYSNATEGEHTGQIARPD